MQFDLTAHLERAITFSTKTFGPGWRAGVLDHILKEVEEVRLDPSDLEEWIDLIMLGFDAAWRGGQYDARRVSHTFGFNFPGRSIAHLWDTTDSILDHITSLVAVLCKEPMRLPSALMIVEWAIAGAYLNGCSAEQISEALVAKQTKNEGRQWPDWRLMPTDKAIEHVRT